jgi:hypothetical protein
MAVNRIGALMIEFLASIVGAVVAGAVAKAEDVGGRAVTDAYDALRALIVRKLGKGGAVKSVEDEPRSESAQAALAEALTKAGLAADLELVHHAEALRAAVARAAGAGGAAIEVGDIIGKANVLVSNLVATGRIELGDIRAETGDATLTNLTAGAAAPKRSQSEGDAGNAPLLAKTMNRTDWDPNILTGGISAGRDVIIGTPPAQHGKRDIPQVTREALKALHDLDNAVRKTIGPLTRFDKDWREDQRRQALADMQLLADTEIILPEVRRLVAELDRKLAETGDRSAAVSAAAAAVLNIGKTALKALGSPVTPWNSAAELAELLSVFGNATTDEMAKFVRDQAGKVLTVVDRQALAEADGLAGGLP